MQGLKFVEENWGEFCAMARKRSMNRSHVEELLIDVVIDRVPRALELYDESHGTTLKQYVFDSIRRYMIKELMRLKHTQSLSDICVDEPAYTQRYNLDAEEEVHKLLEDVHPYYCWLLKTYSIGWSFTEIAESIGVSKCTIRNNYLDALEAVRENYAQR